MCEAQACAMYAHNRKHMSLFFLPEPNSQSRPPPRVLDLFSGQGSWRNAFLQRGCDVVPLDWDSKSDVEICEDILKWKYWVDFKKGDFDIICASIPCEHYSTARTTAPRNIPYANRLAKKTLEIINYFQPPEWFIENPRFGLLRYQKFIKGLHFIDVDYCCFENYGYKKPARIWGPPCIRSLSNVLCDPTKCPCVVQGQGGRLRHETWLGGREYQPSKQSKWRIPPLLIQYLLTMDEHAPCFPIAKAQIDPKYPRHLSTSSPPPPSSRTTKQPTGLPKNCHVPSNASSPPYPLSKKKMAVGQFLRKIGHMLIQFAQIFQKIGQKLMHQVVTGLKVFKSTMNFYFLRQSYVSQRPCLRTSFMIRMYLMVMLGVQNCMQKLKEGIPCLIMP